jgi:hypothetical protein
MNKGAQRSIRGGFLTRLESKLQLYGWLVPLMLLGAMLFICGGLAMFMVLDSILPI